MHDAEISDPEASRVTLPAAALYCTSGLSMLQPEFATYEMRNPKPGKGLGYFVA